MTAELRSLDDHNSAQQRVWEDRRRTGIACPDCGNELLWHHGIYAGPFGLNGPPTSPAICEYHACPGESRIHMVITP